MGKATQASQLQLLNPDSSGKLEVKTIHPGFMPGWHP